MRRYRLGTRKSELALTQSNWVRERLESMGVECELIPIHSAGDLDQTTPLNEAAKHNPGIFVKQLEQELLAGTVDFVVHSLKDMPVQQPPELKVVSVPIREDRRDCLVVSKKVYSPSLKLNLMPGSRVGTSSLRREALLMGERNDLVLFPVRGNVPTRVRKVGNELDAVMLAMAGLNRLGMDLSPYELIPLAESRFPAAPAQGALGIEVRRDCPSPLLNSLSQFHHPDTFREVSLERRILERLHGGCSLPLGVSCRTVEGKYLKVYSFFGVRQRSDLGGWESFHRFDIEGTDDDTLVDGVVSFFERECQ